jgi:hypothetical protein
MTKHPPGPPMTLLSADLIAIGVAIGVILALA